jgi:sulfur-carrier protein
MPSVWIPSLLRDLTGGQGTLAVSGDTVRQIIDNLDATYPGIKARLCDGDRLRPTLTVVVDGKVSQQRLRQPVTETSEVHFIPSLSGG